MPDMNEFLELAHRAGIGTLNSLAIAEALEISRSYVQKLRSGSELVRPPIRAKLDALIAAKANGPVEEVEVDLPNPSSPHSAVFVGDAVARYQIQEMPIGFFKVVSVAAMTRDRAIAERICDLLNKEGG